MWNYTEKVMDHFLHPRNSGQIDEPDAVGEVGNITCGDALKLFLKLDEGKRCIVDAKFQTFGCASAIASASALTELVKGKTVDEAGRISNQDIAEYLGELPEEKMHCSVMGMEALQAAIAHLRGEGDGRATAGDHGGGEEYDPAGLDRVVCYCFSVTERKIRDVIKGNTLKTVDEVTHYCKAGGGCGGCSEQIQAILDTMTEHPVSGPAEQSEPDATPQMTNIQKMMKIQQVLAEEIIPGLEADGGGLDLVDIVGDRVIVRLKGSCAGCPGASVTLKRWVEAKLRERVSPELVVAANEG